MSDYVRDHPYDDDQGFPEQIQKRIEAGMKCGSSIGKGWLNLIVELDEKLAQICPEYKIDQIKEKFGGLRFYVSDLGQNHEAGYKLINEAESESYNICELCGEPADLRSGSWLRTLCDNHHNSR